MEDGDSQVSHTSQASRVSQVSEPPATHGTSADATVHSETDTMTLQDILNHADTTFVARESGVEINDTRVSSSTSQSRLPSLSKDIITMLIDMDNENYSKNPEEESSSLSPSHFEKDPRLSDTVISSFPPQFSKPKDSDSSPREEKTVQASKQTENRTSLTQTVSISSEDSITPNTCFSSYTSDQLVQLSEKYKNLVVELGRHEDVEILLNINSVFLLNFRNVQALSDKLAAKEENPATDDTVTCRQNTRWLRIASRPLVRDGSLMVVPRMSVIHSENVNNDCWENNHGLAEAVEPEASQDIPGVNTPAESPPEAEIPSRSSSCESPIPAEPAELTYRVNSPKYRSRKRRTIVSSHRVKPFRLGGQIPREKNEESTSCSEPSKNSACFDSNSKNSPTHPLERTVIQVDLDLDNPQVPEDNEEAQQRFFRAMEDSINQLRRKSYDLHLVDVLQRQATGDERARRPSLVRGIAEAVDSMQRLADETTGRENCLEGRGGGEESRADKEGRDDEESSESEAMTRERRNTRRGSIKRDRENDSAGECTAIKRID